MPAEKNTYELYDGSVVIDFWPNQHRYSLQGEKEWLVSVTGATGIIDKSAALIPWAVNLGRDHLLETLERNGKIEHQDILDAAQKHREKKEKAGDLGSQVHAYAEAYGLWKIGTGEMPEVAPDAPEEVRNGIRAFHEFLESHQVGFVGAERLVYSKDLGYVGTTDAIAYVNGKLVVVDYKTSKAIYPEMWYQVAAYALAWNEEFPSNQVEGAVILHFDKEGAGLDKMEFDALDLSEHVQTFLHCLAVKKADKKNSKR